MIRMNMYEHVWLHRHRVITNTEVCACSFSLETQARLNLKFNRTCSMVSIQDWLFFWWCDLRSQNYRSSK